MGQPRRNQISLHATPYYHLVSRCVRREFLCGHDSQTGRDYSYRRDWIVRRLDRLAGTFAVELCAYAVMSNHYHLVVRIDEETARSWTPLEVFSRWLRVFKGPAWMQEIVQSGHQMTSHPSMSILAAMYRSRLMSLSWFMRCLNEPIARRANREDGVSGHFWQGRYRCQALLDEGALMAAMAYVDLNPLRAGMVERPEDAGYASSSKRFSSAANPPRAVGGPPLMEFLPAHPVESHGRGVTLPSTLLEYLDLIDWSGRCVARNSRAVIAPATPPVLSRLGIGSQEFRQFVAGNHRHDLSALGDRESLESWAGLFGRRHSRGSRLIAALFGGAGKRLRFSSREFVGRSRMPLPST